MSDLIERLEKESARARVDDGSECCFAPKWTCCDPALLTEAAARIREVEAEKPELKRLAYERWEIANARIRELEVRIETLSIESATSRLAENRERERAREAESQLFASRDALQGMIQRAEKAEAERGALQEHLADLPKGFREWNAQIAAIEAATIERCARVADEYARKDNRSAVTVCDLAATAIRALKPLGGAQSEKPVNPYLLGGSSTQSEG